MIHKSIEFLEITEMALVVTLVSNERFESTVTTLVTTQREKCRMILKYLYALIITLVYYELEKHKIFGKYWNG